MRSYAHHPITLRFRDASLETEFQTDFERRWRPMVRAALVLGLLQYAGFGMLDRFVAPVAFEQVRVIRFVVCALIAVGIAATWSPRLRHWLHPALSVGLLGGLGVVAMEWAVHRALPAGHTTIGTGATTGLLILDGYYYSGMMLVLIYVHVLLRLRFVAATALGGLLIALYLGLAALHTDPVRFANAALFLMSTQGSGMVASYALEWYARRAYVQTHRQGEGNAVLREALDRLTEAQTRLVQTEKLASLGRLTSGIAHELKNPLNFVVNFSDLAADLADEARQALESSDEAAADEALALLFDNLSRIHEHACRADAIVGRMQSHAGGSSGTRQTFAVNEFVEDAVRRAHAASWPPEAVACTLEVDLDPDAGTVCASSDALGHALEGLISNACDALGERLAASTGDGAPPSGDPWGPAIHVSTRRVGETVEIAVSDNGPGLADRVRDHLFEPFVTTKSLGHGVGLSLSLARDVAEAHGGTLDVESIRDHGATFRLTLPIRRPLEVEADEAEAA